MKIALGKKLKMSQIFDKDGIVHPVTVLSISPITITQIKNKEKDGYSSVQVGFDKKKEKFNIHKEFKGETEGMSVGETIDPLTVFKPGDVVRLSAVSKGKGFQGVVKRHGFAGGPRTHGQKHDERGGGAIGSGLKGRVAKGTKMPGRMGGNKVTIKGSQILDIDGEEKIMLIKGSVPGRQGTLIEIQGI